MPSEYIALMLESVRLIASVLGFITLGTRVMTVPARQVLGANYIAYTSHAQLWIANTAGKPVRRVDVPGYAFSSPDWSADGKLAFMATRLLGHHDEFVCTANAQGGDFKEVVRLGANVPYAGPVWSPDGKTLAFAKGKSLCTVRATGARFTRIGGFVGKPNVSGWSPDGRKILFASITPSTAHTGFYQLFQISANGQSKAVNVTPSAFRQPKCAALDPKWMPDHRHIAFIGNSAVSGPRSKLFMFDPRRPKLAPKLILADPSESYDDGQFSFSPDGHFIVLERSPSEMGTPSIWICGMDGSAARSLITEPDPEPREGVGAPSWSPVLVGRKS